MRHETSKRHKTTRQEGANLFGCGLTTPSLFVLLSFIFLFFRKEFPLDFFLREALFQTAAPLEPLTFSAFRFFLFKQILQRIDGPAVRHSVCSVYSVDYKKNSCSFVSIRGSK